MQDMRSSRIKSGTQYLIDMHGQTRVYESVGSEVYDPDTQTVTSTTQLYTVKMFATAPSYKETRTPDLVGKKLTTYLISASELGVTPKVGDKITDIYLGNEVLEVGSFSYYEAQGSICMWRVVCVSA